MNIESLREVWIPFEAGLPAGLSQGHDIWHRDIVQGQCGRPGNRARHVGHAIVHDTFFDVGRIGMRRLVDRLDATTLVDSHVHLNDERSTMNDRPEPVLYFPHATCRVRRASSLLSGHACAALPYRWAGAPSGSGSPEDGRIPGDGRSVLLLTAIPLIGLVLTHFVLRLTAGS